MELSEGLERKRKMMDGDMRFAQRVTGMRPEELLNGTEAFEDRMNEQTIDELITVDLLSRGVTLAEIFDPEAKKDIKREVGENLNRLFQEVPENEREESKQRIEDYYAEATVKALPVLEKEDPRLAKDLLKKTGADAEKIRDIEEKIRAEEKEEKTAGKEAAASEKKADGPEKQEEKNAEEAKKEAEKKEAEKKEAEKKEEAERQAERSEKPAENNRDAGRREQSGKEASRSAQNTGLGNDGNEIDGMDILREKALQAVLHVQDFLKNDQVLDADEQKALVQDMKVITFAKIVDVENKRLPGGQKGAVEQSVRKVNSGEKLDSMIERTSFPGLEGMENPTKDLVKELFGDGKVDKMVNSMVDRAKKEAGSQRTNQSDHARRTREADRIKSPSISTPVKGL